MKYPASRIIQFQGRTSVLRYNKAGKSREPRTSNKNIRRMRETSWIVNYDNASQSTLDKANCYTGSWICVPIDYMVQLSPDQSLVFLSDYCLEL